MNLIKTSRNTKAYNCYYRSSTHDNFLFLLRKNEEQAHTTIVTGWDASYGPTCCHNSCSYQILVLVEIMDVNGQGVKNVCSYQVLLIVIEIKDVDEDRRIIFHRISQALM